jgi:hypothetical protein
MSLRNSLLSVGLPVLASEDGGTVLMMRSAQSAAASSSTSGWQTRAACASGPDGSQEVVRQVRGEASELSQELRRLAIAHLLKRDYPVSALLPREGQPFQQLGSRLGLWVLLGRRGDDIPQLCGVSLVQLRYGIMGFCPLTADAGQRILRLSLGEPHGWSLGPERRKPHGHSGYLRSLAAVDCLDSSSALVLVLTSKGPLLHWTE